MDERLERALEFSNFRLTLANQRVNLKNATFDRVLVFENSGQFMADPTTISYVSVLSQKNESAILLDQNANPIKINNLNEFLDKLLSVHFESMNTYYEEYQKMTRSRNMLKLLNLEDDEL